MSNIHKSLKFQRIARNYIRCFTGKPKVSYTLESLQNRELIRVHGAEVTPFLQGLVTQDISRLQDPNGPSSMYSMFLNRAGRLIYDTIIYRTNDPETYLIECDSDASPDFRRHLRTYRVRKLIDIDTVDDEYVPWVLFDKKGKTGDAEMRTQNSKELFISPDPRIANLGTRVLAPSDMDESELAKILLRSHDVVAVSPSEDVNYKLLRYKMGIGEGVEELPPGKCFPLEANADYLNGVSFNKGCYVGQELTARVHHSGVIRKRYMPIRFTAPLKSDFTVKSVAGANLGRVFGHAHNHGVALLRIEPVLTSAQQLVLDGVRCFAERPQWWPNDPAVKRNMVDIELTNL